MKTFRAGFAVPLEMRDELDRLWTSLTAAPPFSDLGLRPVGAFPPVNLRETAEALILEAEVPGLRVGDVNLSVTAEELVLKGSRAGETPAEAAAESEASATDRPITWHRRERGTGDFERRLPLPVAVDSSRVEARLVDGVLTVTCPKAVANVPRRVEVRTS